jgi:hypothetical protein
MSLSPNIPLELSFEQSDIVWQKAEGQRGKGAQEKNNNAQCPMPIFDY